MAWYELIEDFWYKSYEEIMDEMEVIKSGEKD